MSAVANRSSHRIETLHDMLSHYQDALAEAAGAGEGGSRTESRLLALDPATWTDSFRELDRCLERLKYLAGHGRPMIDEGVSSGAAWWNIRARYLEAEVSRRRVHLRKTHHGERQPAPLPRNAEVVSRPIVLQGSSIEILPERGSSAVAYMMVRTWNEGVDPLVVAAALRWISREYRGTPQPYAVA